MSKFSNLASAVNVHNVRWAGLKEDIDRVEMILSAAKDETPDRCKTLCETVMKEILAVVKGFSASELNGMMPEELKNQICSELNLSDQDQKLVNSQLTFLIETRNAEGTSGHGRLTSESRAIRDNLDEDRMQMIVNVADASLSFLITQFEKQYPLVADDEVTRNEDYDRSIDESYGELVIFDVPYLASDVQYTLDPTAYEEGKMKFEGSEDE